ncbi:MAG: iron-sulfur cluster repair di-iron protein [Myxococcales bacterium]|nr:iron-sulfur cluster repair di-iron protein [Myxococcales bacterium]
MGDLLAEKVGDIAARSPHATRVLERAGIDYCCGGKRTLGEACALAKVAPTELVAALADAPAAKEGENFVDMPLVALIDHLLETHHVFTRAALARLDGLSAKVARVHGERHPEVVEIRRAFEVLRDDLTAHLFKEENILFPYVRGKIEGRTGMMLDSAAGPIHVMDHEHEETGEILRELRRRSDGYTPPVDACGSFQALYAGLAELEADLHQHIHLESNILFPRTMALEE